MIEPYSTACERNKEPILSVLKELLQGDELILEIGSGTGQHAVFFATQLPNISWQTSDLLENHAGILNWINNENITNVLRPLILDVNQPEWPIQNPDLIFSANTAHIMSWASVDNMFSGVGKILKSGSFFVLYGPFNYQGQYTSDSNRQFDKMLQQRDPKSAIRDFEALEELAKKNKMRLYDDIAMPANNRILIFQK